MLMRFLLVLLILASPRARAEVPPTAYFGSAPVDIYVAASGADIPSCGDTAVNPCLTPLYASRDLPDGWTAPVSVNMPAGDWDIPTHTWTQRPGALKVGGVTQTGGLQFRSVCASPLFTTSSITGSVDTGFPSLMDFASTPGWTGTVGEATHYVRSTGASGTDSFLITKASTSPDLRLVIRTSSPLPTVRLCPWDTTISSTAQYEGVLTGTGLNAVSFAGIKFTGSPAFVGVKLAGVHANPASMTDVTVRGAYFSHVGTTYASASEPARSTFSSVYWEGCPQFRGTFLSFGGFVKGNCTQPGQAQLSIGIYNEDNGVYGSHGIRNFAAVDFADPVRPCLSARRSALRFGTGTGQDVACNSTGGFGTFDFHSDVTIHSGVVISGTTGAPAVVKGGSQLGPLNGGYQIVVSTAATTGDFTNGGTTAVLKSGLPSYDGDHGTRIIP